MNHAWSTIGITNMLTADARDVPTGRTRKQLHSVQCDALAPVCPYGFFYYKICVGTTLLEVAILLRLTTRQSTGNGGKRFEGCYA